ncbi:MAG: tRNA (adenosine(37)-N6)-threonylcarbamoyltransferase complex dimerization subunit type 1 TsaB [Acidobacteriaceae bacterium]
MLIDTCGDTAGVAISQGDHVLASEDLAPGSASAEILQAMRRLLARLDWRVENLDAVGVVRGPGSFTGIRAGLATAKGLCESVNLRLAAVSRLEVLAEAAGLQSGLAVLDAGRGELYVRETASSREWLSSIEELAHHPDGLEGERSLQIAIAESQMVERLNAFAMILRPLRASDALPAILRKLRTGGSDVALVDANYVREERDIYQKPPSSPHPTERAR